jgi:hypothetical protein
VNWETDMTDTPREWVDIDTEWLQAYLQEQDLAHAFELEDDMLAAQASWILSADEWEQLRAAWEERLAADAPPHPVAAQPAQVTQQPAGTGSVAAQETGDSPTEQSVTATVGIQPPNESQRLHELTRKALSDWHAFKELFRDCPESSDADAWEALADSPAALLTHASKLIAMQEARNEGLQRQTKQEFEQDVSRVRYSIAGYHLYCRKHRLKPSLEHLLDFIPVLRTDHSPAVVTEAWRREQEQVSGNR